MGCCCSEPIYETVETQQSVSNNIYFQRRPRTISFHINNDSLLKSYEDKVLIATIKAQEEDSNIY